MRMRKIFCFLLGVVLLTTSVLVLPSSAADSETWQDQDASNTAPALVGDVYQISSAENFAYFCKTGGAIKGVLTCNIDLSAHLWKWQVSGLGTNGTLDGAGYAVTGMTITENIPKDKSGALFGDLWGGTIKNLKLEVKVGTAGNPVVLNYWRAGIIAGNTGYNAKVSNVHVDIESYCNSTLNNGGYFSLGGFFGALAGITVENCTLSGSMTETSANYVYMGGFAPQTWGSNGATTFTNCVNYANLTRKSGTSTAYMGGFLGQPRNNSAGAPVTFTNCVNYGTLTLGATNARVGGFIGEFNSQYVTLQSCANFGNIQANGSSSSAAAGLIGFLNGANTPPTIDGCLVVNSYLTSMNNNQTWITNSVALGMSSEFAQDLPIAMETGAQIRMKDGISGLRFNSTISKDVWDKLDGKSGISASVGTVIAPTAHVQGAVNYAGSFSMAALAEYKTIKNITTSSGETIYRDIPVDEWSATSEANYSFNGSLTRIYAENYNLSFSAIPYLKIAVENGGTFYLYGAYNESNHARTVRAVATAAYNDRAETENGETTYGYIGRYDLSTTYESANGAWSPYTAEQMALIAAYVN